MRTVTTTLVALLAALMLLGACGGDDGAAKAQKIKDLKDQLKAVNGEIAAGYDQWQPIRDKVIPLQKAFKRAKGSPEEAAAKAALDDASAAAQVTIDAEQKLKDKRKELEDAIARAGG